MLGVDGLVLSAADREHLAHPMVGGVILFTRNYAHPAQLAELTAAIRALRVPALLIAVDHEGGHVQRFRDGFTAIPPMRTLGEQWDRDVAGAAREAVRLGWTIASELRAAGIDFSFGPVLDLDYGESTVIGNRALHRNPNAAAHLAAALHDGMRAGGMAAVGKHFPGHGFVAADSHTDVPVDERPLAAIVADDLVPFGVLVRQGLDGVMPAHVIYPAVDPLPAGYSPKWLQEVLRGRLGFDGLVFSDDLGMAGARGAGDIVARAEAAVAAGCDMILVCNDPDAADDLLARWAHVPRGEFLRRAARMEGRAPAPAPH
jgi:beta-N-acetylhexosaminidase